MYISLCSFISAEPSTLSPSIFDGQLLQEQYQSPTSMDIMETTKAEQCIPPLLLAAQMPSCNQSYLFQGKMVLLDKLLSKLKERDSRALKFTQVVWACMELSIMYSIELLAKLEVRDQMPCRPTHFRDWTSPDYLMFHGYQHSRIEDNIDGEHRHASIAVFVAINLATADIDILYHSDWLTYKLKIRLIGFARRKKLKFTYSAQRLGYSIFAHNKYHRMKKNLWCLKRKKKASIGKVETACII
ncbi:probable chromatin-remodeling complex ATPase chain isoform X2 [Lotus japonicus]|uniref:probable chromatin-remodeling complex ATPase chain isoform X2 n=1 Tax=Lotus japonicus TaxID=34305 RepID=UPI0025862D8C|nr:probable chromatin-remodeling complex ATPase chain isoform X2 [Lotus japonicus]